METPATAQLISSHLKSYPIHDYFVGLDIGTNSVGWAVTNRIYELLKFHSHKMWGSRLFEEGQTAVGRRSFRSIRRRLERRRLRLKLLEALFADAMASVDPTFFIRLRESKYHYEDKTTGHKSKHILFIDGNYTDQDYFAEYPTVYHLRADLMENGTDDIRKLFLAVHHILKYRGNFLYEGATFDSNASLDTVLKQALEQIEFYLFDVKSEDALHSILDILKLQDKTKSDKAKAIESLVDTYSIDKVDSGCKDKGKKDLLKADKKRLRAFANLILGLSANLIDLFGIVEDIEDDLGKLQITGDTYDDKRDDYAKVWGDSIRIIDDCKIVYDSIILMSIKEPGFTISQSKVKAFNKHKEDLVILKRLLKSDMHIYKNMFKADEKNLTNYVHYIKQGRKDETSCSCEDFYKYTKKVVESLPDSKDKEYILNEIELQKLLPLQRIKDNGVIPYQLHLEELKAILEKCKNTFSFLNTESDGYTVIEKLVKMLEFRIPYYVGPLNPNYSIDKGGFAWVVRKEPGQVTPWNFEDKIDREKSAEAFIKNLTNKCTYLIGEDVLPKSSLLYSEFMLLNELNNLRVDGKPLEQAVKMHLIDAEFKKEHKKLTENRIIQFLKDNNYIPCKHKPEIDGLDESIKGDLASHRDMARILGDDFDVSMAESIIASITIFGESKKMLRETLRKKFGSILSDDQIKRLAKLRYRDWGRLSKKLLTGIDGCVKGEDGTPSTIIDMMRHTSCNLMELLGDKFSFMDVIIEENDKLTKGQVVDPHEIIEELGLSPAVKRAVWQALRIVDEVVHIKKALPARIFVEVARTNKDEKKKKDSRKKRLQELYKSIQKESPEWLTVTRDESDKLISNLNSADDASLRSKKLYLYYTQLGRCMYSGRPIDLDQLNTDKYDIDHIYPRSLTKDDSFDNLVLCERQENAKKSDDYPIHPDIQNARKPFWSFLKEKALISSRKYERLTRILPLGENDLSGFIARQLVETNQSVKAVTTLLRRLYPGVDVVFVKAENVTDFRHDNNFIKVRSLNHHHHAKDAYLNIVVGNVYHEKFTCNCRKFFKKNGAKRTYNLARMFDFDVMSTNAKDGKAWDTKTSMDIVKKMMASNDVRVTRRVKVQKGGITKKQTIYKANVAAKSPDSYLGMKTQNSVLSDVCKYGGVRDIQIAHFAAVEYTNTKGDVIREIIAIPVYIRSQQFNKITLAQYVKTLKPKIKNLSIIFDKIYFDQLVKIDGFYYFFGGKSNERFYIDNAIQLIEPLEIQFYIRLIEKFINTYSVNKDIKASTIKSRNPISNQSENLSSKITIKLFDNLLSKLEQPIYLNMKGNKREDLKEKGKAIFMTLNLEEQCLALQEILNLITNMNTMLSLNMVKLTASRKVINFKLSKLNEFKIINESITGLYSNEVTIV